MKYFNIYSFFKKLPKQVKKHLLTKFSIEIMFYLFILFGYFVFGIIGYYLKISPSIIAIIWVIFFVILTVLKVIIDIKYPYQHNSFLK